MRGYVLPIYVPTLLSAIARGAALVLLPLYALDTAEGAVLAAAVVGLRSAGTMIVDVPSGAFIDRIGDKAVMLLGLGLLVVTAVVAAFAESALLLAVVAVAFGIGTGAWLMGRLAQVTERVHFEQRGRVVSVMAGLERAGAVVGPLLAGFAAEFLGYQQGFLFTAVLFGIAFLFCAVFATKSKPRAGHLDRARLTPILLKYSQIFIRGGAVMTVLSFLRNGRQLIIPVWGVAIGLDPSEIGLAFSLSSIVDMLMFYPAGLIMDHIGRKAALVPCLLLLGLSFALLPLTDSFWEFVAVAMLSGLGNGFGTGIFMTMGSDYAPRHGRAQFLGVWRLIGDSGGTMGPFAIGAITEAVSMHVACIASGGLSVIAVGVLLVWVPESRQGR